MAGAAASLAVACGALIGVTDPDLRADAADGGGGASHDGGGGGTTCDAADPNCGACDPVDGAGCGDIDLTTPLGEVRQIVVGGNDLYIAQSDGIYRLSKTGSPEGDGSVDAKKIAGIAEARLSTGSPQGKPTLYAVGANPKGVKIAASCTIPCDGDSWIEVEASDSATSIVVDGDRLFLVDSVSITEIAENLMPGDVGGIPVDIKNLKGSRIRSRAGYLYWVQEGGNSVKECDYPTIRDYPSSTSGLDVDMLSMLVPASTVTNSFVVYVLLGESEVAVARRTVQDNSPINSSITRQKLEEGGALQELAFAADEKSYYIRSESRIYECPLPPPSSSTAGCTALYPSAGWKPSASIVSMAIDGESLYYAAVTTSDDGGKVGSIARIPLAGSR